MVTVNVENIAYNDIYPFIKLNQLVQNKKTIRLEQSRKYSITKTLLIVPIIISDDVKGLMVIVESDIPVSHFDKTTIEQSCTIIALELLKNEAIYETKQRLKREFLTYISSNVDIELLKKQAKYIGIKESNFHFFVSIEFDDLLLNSNAIHFKERCESVGCCK